MEKGWKKRFDAVHEQIMRSHRAGLCNNSGESVKTVGGRFIAKPRYTRRGSFDTRDTFLEKYKAGLIR